MVNINKYIKALLHPASGHQGSHKAHLAGNQSVWGQWHVDISLALTKSSSFGLDYDFIKWFNK